MSGPPIPAPAAVLFDLDGTLADTLPDIAWALNGAREELGLPVVEDARVRGSIGSGARRLCARSLGVEDEADPRVERLLAGFRRRYDTHAGERARLYPGVEPLLNLLAGRGILLACVTNKPDVPARRTLGSLGIVRQFAAVVTPEAVGGAVKPDPALLLAALARLGGVAPSRALVVGDGVQDIRGARAAGIPVAAVLSGYGDPEALRAESADWYLARTPELVLILNPARSFGLPGAGPASGGLLQLRTNGPGSVLHTPEVARRLALVVEDDGELRGLYRGLLEAEGYEAIAAASAEEALRLLGDREPDLFVSDAGLPGASGVDLFLTLERRFPDLARHTVLVTGLADSESVGPLRSRPGLTVIEKPFRTGAFLAACSRAAGR